MPSGRRTPNRGYDSTSRRPFQLPARATVPPSTRGRLQRGGVFLRALETAKFAKDASKTSRHVSLECASRPPWHFLYLGVLAVYFFLPCYRKPRERDVRILFWNQDSGGRNNTDEYLSERPLNPSVKSVGRPQDGPASGGKRPNVTALRSFAAR